jgi:hypothetical protein
MPSIANCVLSLSGLNGAFVHSSAAATVATFEARAQFSAAQWEHIGWGALDFNGDQYLLFSTFNQTSHLYARSNLGGGETRTDLGVMPSGFHTYRIERVAISGVDHVRYSIDGIQLADHIPGGTVPTLYVYLSHNSQTTTPTLDIHSISVSAPFITTGTFDSAPMDAGKTVAWTTATWTATLPPNTTLAVRTRTSNDGSTWSTWSAPLTTTGAPLTSPAGRYAQYRLELSTSDPTTSPSVQSVTLTFNSQ